MADARLPLEGPLVLARMPSLQEEIARVLDETDSVLLDVSGATEIDVSFLQLLISAHKTAKLQQKHLSVATDGSDRLAAQIARCGLPASVLPDFRDVFPATTGPVV